MYLFLEEFCLDEKQNQFAEYLLQKATVEDMEAFIQSRRSLESEYSEFERQMNEQLEEAEADFTNDLYEEVE